MTPLPKAKLQLLYLIHKADTPARYEELVEACVDWLPYFDFQLSLNELVEQGLIAYKYGTDSNRRIVIQDKGRQILSVFEKEIPLHNRKQLDVQASKLAAKARITSEYAASYQKLDQNQYVVYLRILEKGFTIMEIRTYVSNLLQAQQLCDLWPQNAKATYAAMCAEPAGGQDA